MDMTEAEYVDCTPRMQLNEVALTVLNEDNKDTIFNVIIMEEDKDTTDG